MFGKEPQINSRKRLREGGLNFRKGERVKAKVEKGKCLPPRETQGMTTRRWESVSTILGGMGIASTQRRANLSMKAPKGGAKEESENMALP
jgi:hypothetical protein